MMWTAAVVVAAALAGAGGPPPQKCGGPYVPPTDYDANGRPVTLEFAVSSGGPGTPRDAVGREAQRSLVSRLCRLADPAFCAPIEARAKVWSFGEDARGVCAMAVISSVDLEAWRTMLAPDLDRELKGALARVFPAPDERKSVLGFAGRKKKSTAVVILDRIDDNGTAGGVRADWLLGRVRAALTDLDIDMMEPPKGWTGRLFGGLAKEAEYTLRGTLVEAVDPKTQLPMLDVTFLVTDRKGFGRSSVPFQIPAALAPMPPSKVPPPPAPVGLSLHVESSRGGSLCPGDYTQLHLTNETEEPLYVRVFNLDANGEALVLFPNEMMPDEPVPAGQTIALSPDGFTVDGAAHGRERYIAIGARTREALTRFRDVRGTCRFSPGDAKFLAASQNIDATFRAAAGFTLLDDVRCKKAIPLPDPKLLAQALGEIPFCKPLDR
jgi:hypothetical protein